MLKYHSDAKMALTTARLNYLVQVTVVGTSNPAVTRLISIAATATFDALHKAIEAAFGWEMEEGDGGIYSFEVIEGNPFARHQDDWENTLLAIWESESAESGYHTLGNAPMVELHKVFDNFEYREHGLKHAYNGPFEGPKQAIQVLGRTTSAMGKKAVCLGGQGHTSLKAWSQAQPLTKAIRSTWDLDLNAVNARMADIWY